MTEGVSICLVAEVRATILVQRSIVSSGVTQVAERDRNMKTDVKFVAEQLRDNEELERRARFKAALTAAMMSTTD
ncbi:hypothetical protein [Nitrobacter vulgaris]|uniref:Uncharacterized protein n=1 Tax=Nitrobacter vulgaris TaxID=29421 RepID=A0A1V4HWF0_NITVU|nr:hypothetical protein [Nitrobacter vulgaris]OPH81890.1 hypothetical protein B2M20_15615 [Nitrobacter vulgaris]